MSFACSTPGCEKEAEVGGLCIPCYNKDYNRRHRADNGEGKSPWEDKKEKEMTMTDKEKKTGTLRRRRSKQSVCLDCGRNTEQAGRFYKMRCSDCRKKNKNKPPEPPKPDLGPQRSMGHGPEEFNKSISLGLLVLDFTGHADLLKALAEAGKKEFRIPSGQAMAILEKTLKGVKP